MPWIEVDKTDDTELEETRRMLARMAPWYVEMGKAVKIRKLMGRGAHLYRFRNADHKIVILFKHIKGQGWKAHHCAYEGSKPKLASRLVANKIFEFMEFKGIVRVHAHVPDALTDATIKQFYTFFKSDAWEVEVTPVRDGEYWLMRKSKKRP